MVQPQGLTADAWTRYDGSARTSRSGAFGTRPGVVRRSPPGLAAEATSAPVYSHPRPSGASGFLLLVNLGPVKVLCLGSKNGNKILFHVPDELYPISTIYYAEYYAVQ